MRAEQETMETPEGSEAELNERSEAQEFFTSCWRKCGCDKVPGKANVPAPEYHQHHRKGIIYG